MRKIFILDIFLLLVIITIALTLMHKTNAFEEGKIVFTGEGNPGSDIYSINIGGKNPKNLTNHPAIDNKPAPSPNGRYIAFISWRKGASALFIMDVDENNPKLLLDNVDDRPSWSPDSKWIAFKKENRLLTMNINSGEIKEIKFPLGMGGFFITGMTAWSPDGQKIALMLLGVLGADGDKFGEIYTINVDGTNPRRLTNDPLRDESPSWSSDGKQIAFYSYRDGGGIYIMDSDGANVKLIHKISGGCCPSWWNNKVVFSSVSVKDLIIFIINSDGSNIRQIFKGGWMPSWLGLLPFYVESEGKWKTTLGKIKRGF